jgi:hypothetical protein
MNLYWVSLTWIKKEFLFSRIERGSLAMLCVCVCTSVCICGFGTKLIQSCDLSSRNKALLNIKALFKESFWDFSEGVVQHNLFFFFAVLGIEFRAYTLSQSTNPFFVMDFFEIGSQKVFTRPGFKPRSSFSLPPE